jgi:hypothetical protein
MGGASYLVEVEVDIVEVNVDIVEVNVVEQVSTRRCRCRRDRDQDAKSSTLWMADRDTGD